MLRRSCVLLLAFLLSTLLGFAQDTRGNIVGKIADPSGAVIAGAEVLVTNIAMGTKLAAKTNDTGYYQAPFLIPGMYRIEVISPGFKKSVRDNVQIQVNDRIEMDFVLEIGGAEQSINVTEEAPLMNTESASVGTVVDSKRVSDLPLSYGNPFSLIGLAGGVSFTGDARLDRPFEPTHIVGYAMAGTRGNLSDVTLDGAPTTATASGNQVIASYVPPTDIVQEFKVQTSTFDAQFGQTQGGVTNISIKSGSNALHGTGYFSFYRPSLWANDLFANASGKSRPDFWFNRWGGSLGGPVYIPKVYNGKNRTFFMWGYEGIHDSRPRYDSSVTTVPTPAMKTGDFSSLLALGSSYQIYDPATRRAVTGGRYQEDAFPGNLVPASRFNSVSKNVLKYLPEPTSTALADGTANLQRPDMAERAAYYNHSWRVDHTISDKQRIFARASVYRRDSTYNNYFDNLSTGVFFEFASRAAVFDDVYMISPTMVLDTRYSYNRFIRFQDQNQAAMGFDLTSLGFPSSYASLIPKDVGRFPQFNMLGYIPTGSTSGENRPVMNHTVASTLTKIKGSHSIRTGFEYRVYQETDKFFGYQQTGAFTFDSTWTKGPLDNASTSPSNLGQSVAAFLLGLPSATSFVQRTADYAEQSGAWGFFIQDDWKVAKKLTINLGLRYEIERPLHERYNKSVLDFDTTYTQPFSATAQANYAKSPITEIPAASFAAKGGLTFAGVDGNPTGLYNVPKRNFMPRVGFAYQIDNHTVLRAGFGMFYGFLGERRGDVIQSGFSQSTNMVLTTDNVNFISSLSNPFPNGITEPVGNKDGKQTFLGQNISFFNQNPKMPRVSRWEFGIQRELKGGFLFQGNYVGNKTLHVEISRNINALPLQYLSTSPARDDTRNSYLTASVTNPFYGLVSGTTQSRFTSTTIARSTLMQPYPEFGTVTGSTNDGYSWYHSLQVSLEKRFSKGFTVMGNYTFSKFMQATEYLNAADAQPVRVISDQDAPHHFSVSGIYQLPFGKGKPFFGGSNRLASRLVGGWQVSGIWSYQSGFPTSFTGTTTGLIYYGDPKNIVRPKSERGVGQWFNTDGFEKASAKQLVNNVRTFPLRFPQLRNPNPNNMDLALIKNTKIKETHEFQFRVEALNALNHPYLPAPTTTVTSVSFGKITSSNLAGYPRRLQLTLKYIF
jgi:hypothetical protein